MPTVLKIERGVASHHPLNKDEPELSPPPESIPAPEVLPPRAKEEWNRLAPELIARGVLTVGDTEGFKTYCTLVATEEDLLKQIQTVGEAIAIQQGFRNAYWKCIGSKKQYMAELGLTPSSRSGVKAVKTSGKSAADKKRERFFGNRTG